ncbi:hypothetical protein MKX03_031130 [Papaver bracteatum]|nr:hypothetical protein MKX03_031130 [Papaver bracteatum]
MMKKKHIEEGGVGIIFWSYKLKLMFLKIQKTRKKKRKKQDGLLCTHLRYRQNRKMIHSLSPSRVNSEGVNMDCYEYYRLQYPQLVMHVYTCVQLHYETLAEINDENRLVGPSRLMLVRVLVVDIIEAMIPYNLLESVISKS